MSVRPLLWLAVALLLAFAAWQFLRALAAARGGADERVSPHTDAAPATSVRAAGRAAGGDGDEDEDEDEDGEGDGGFDYAPVLRADVAAAEAPSATLAAAPPPERFPLELENQRLRRELAALQAASVRQQDEIRALQARLASADIAESPNTSPEYREALALAEQGQGADAIAARCGITVAEAELLTSLASGRGGGR